MSSTELLKNVWHYGEKLTRINQLAYWDIGWLTLAKPLIIWLTKVFLYQDKDADTQAKGYYGLKTEWKLSQKESREFQNPVKETVLRWRN